MQYWKNMNIFKNSLETLAIFECCLKLPFLHLKLTSKIGFVPHNMNIIMRLEKVFLSKESFLGKNYSSGTVEMPVLRS